MGDDELVMLSNVQFLIQSQRPDSFLLSYDLYTIAWLLQDSLGRIAAITQAPGQGRKKKTEPD